MRGKFCLECEMNLSRGSSPIFSAVVMMRTSATTMSLIRSIISASFMRPASILWIAPPASREMKNVGSTLVETAGMT